jgi:hypothetical protein|uniref:Glycosyltransferase 2-like domain-containing protein n=1 Tax=viral metagenome TaxID=1070528 RepID=A0A6C0IQ42_9ZZZZ
MFDVCIGYLTDHRRLYTFDRFVSFVNKLANKDKVCLLILANNVEPSFFENIIKHNLHNVHCRIITFDNNNNYINKINTLISFSKENNIKYCMKCDNDIIINNHALDYMFDNLHLLENKENLFITPSLSSGIPSVDYFIEDFFSESEKDTLYNLFLKTDMPKSLWGFDYSPLNEYTVNSEKWNATQFINKNNQLNYHYKGIHPIRINKEAVLYQHQLILKYKHKIHEKQAYKMHITDDYSYLCNSIFIINADNYRKIIDSRELYVDPYDEVPVNKYFQMNKLRGVYVRNSFTIHPIYNTILDHPNIEQKFYNEFFRDN